MSSWMLILFITTNSTIKKEVISNDLSREQCYSQLTKYRDDNMEGICVPNLKLEGLRPSHHVK